MATTLIPPYDAERHLDYRNQGLIKDDTLSSWIQTSVKHHPDNTALIIGDTSISYVDLLGKVESLAGGLQSLGVKKGDVVAIQLPNVPEYIISYLAIASVGAVMQTLHMPYRRAELRYLLEDSGASAAICLSKFKDYSPAQEIIKLADEAGKPLTVITLGKESDSCLRLETLLYSKEPFEPVKLESSDPFVMLYTSGTTSSPKGVPHRYLGFLNNARLCANEYAFTEASRILSLAPMTHLYGLFTLNMTLSCGASSVLLPVFSPAAFIETLDKLKPTAVFAAPAHFSACIQAGFNDPKYFENVEFVCLSGSHVPFSLAQQVDKLLVNGKVGQLWGMSELQAGAITRLTDQESTRLNTTGSSTPGTELRIVRDGQVINAANEEGELQVKGLSVFDAYLNKTDETRKAFSEDGWFCSGDTASMNETGALTITGRLKNLINRGGVKYNPVEIEEQINKIPQVTQCAIIPVPDTIYIEKACVFLVLQSEQNIGLDDINTFLHSTGIAKYKWPEHIRIIDTMPLTPTNKVKLDELNKLFESTNG